MPDGPGGKRPRRHPRPDQRSLRAPRQRRRRAPQLADLFRQLRLAPLLSTGADRPFQRRRPQGAVGLSDGRRHHRDHARRRGRYPVRYRASEHRERPGRALRPPDLDLVPGDGTGRAQHRLSGREPRGRGTRLHRVRGHAERAPGCPRRALGRRALGCRSRRQRHRVLAHPGPAGGQGQGDRGRVRGGGRRAGLPRRLRRRDGRAGVAHLHHPRARRARKRNLGRQQLGDRGRVHLAYRLLRSRTRPALLAHRQPGARLERRRPPRRQPVHGLPARPRSRHRRDDLVLPVHALTTPTTGTPTRSRCCWTPNGRANRASWW